MTGLTPYERRMAELAVELIPTRPRRATKPEPTSKPIEPWTRAEQDAHWAQLCEAVGTGRAKRPHLRLVVDGEPEPEAEAS